MIIISVDWIIFSATCTIPLARRGYMGSLEALVELFSLDSANAAAIVSEEASSGPLERGESAEFTITF